MKDATAHSLQRSVLFVNERFFLLFQPPGLNFDLEGLNLPDAGGAGGEQCQIM